MEDGKLGRVYGDGEVIIREGEEGDRMFVIQSGKVLITRKSGGQEIPLAELKAGDLFGEMAIINREVRSATVRAIGEVRLLSIDKKNFLRRVHEDPSLAFKVLQRMSQNIRDLSGELAKLKARTDAGP